MRRALLPLLAIASLAAFGFRSLPDDSYSLVHKHVLNETQAVTMKIEGKFGDMNFVSTVDLAQKVTEVAEDGGYTVEVTSGDTKATVNGESVDTGDSGSPNTKTVKYDAKGKEIKSATDEKKEKDATDIAFDYEPKAPVKIGESWTPEKEDEGDPDPLEWTLTGKETVDGKELLVVEGKGKGPDDATVESKIWLDPVSFIARKATSTIRGLKQEDDTEGEMTITIEEKP